MLSNASEFLAINANLLKIAFGRAFAREIRYMGEQYKTSRVTVASGEKGLWVVWYDSDVVKVKAQGREIRIGRILICVRVIIVLVVGINPVTMEW